MHGLSQPVVVLPSAKDSFALPESQSLSEALVCKGDRQWGLNHTYAHHAIAVVTTTGLGSHSS